VGPPSKFHDEPGNLWRRPGGLLLAKTTRESSQLRVALDGPIAQLDAQAPAEA
jgi:hypothetical protein